MITVSYGASSVSIRNTDHVEDSRQYDQSMIVRRTRAGSLMQYRDTGWHDFDIVTIKSKANVSADMSALLAIISAAWGKLVTVTIIHTDDEMNEIYKVFTGLIITNIREVITVQDDCTYDIGFELLICTEATLPHYSELFFPMEDNAANTVVVDSIGANNGVVVGGKTTAEMTTAGKYDTALAFDGVEDGVLLSAVTPANYPITFACWYKADGKAVDRRIVTLHNGGTDASIMSLLVDADDHVVAQTLGDTDARAVSTTKLVNGQWYHVVVVFASKTSRSVYVNGVLEDSDTTDAGNIFGINQTTIGYVSTSTGSEDFAEGSINDVHVYNETLSQEEISVLAGNLSYLRLDDDAADTVITDDYAANTWYLAGPVGITTSYASVAGYVAKAIRAVDMTRIHCASPVATAVPFTVMFWFKPLNSATTRSLFCIRQTEGATSNGFRVYMPTAAAMRVAQIHEATEAYGEYATTLTNGTWYHIATVFATNSLRYLYINGTLRNTNTTASATPHSLGTTTLGMTPALPDPTDNANGDFDEVKMYNWALTQSEILAHYMPADKVLHCRMNDNEADTVIRNGVGANLVTDGTLTSAMTAVGKINAGLSFNGSSRYAKATITPITVAPFTIMCWYKAVVASAVQRLVTVQQLGSSSNYLSLYVKASNVIAARFGSAEDECLEEVEGDTWYHIAIIATAATGLNFTKGIYVNGEEKTNNVGTLTFAGVDTVIIGARNTGSYVEFASGIVDDVRIYNRALTAAELAKIYNAGAGTEA